jgi:hypothetical protein
LAQDEILTFHHLPKLIIISSILKNTLFIAPLLLQTLSIAAASNLEKPTSLNAFGDAGMLINLGNAFIRVQQMGVNGYPTVRLSAENELHMLSQGHENPRALSQQFEQTNQPWATKLKFCQFSTPDSESLPFLQL